MRRDFATHNFTTQFKTKKTPEKMTGVLLFFLLTKTGESSQSRTYFVVATFSHFAKLGHLRSKLVII